MKQWISRVMMVWLFGVSTPALAEDQAAALGRIENYMNQLSTLVAEFMQIAPDGGVSTGTFFLSRPGKFRWQYHPPVPILIIANGSLLTYYDYELDQVSHTSAESNLAHFLTQQTIRFNKDAEVLNFKQDAGIFRVTIAQKGKRQEGQLTMIFNQDPIMLKKLELTDATGQQTSVSFSNIQLGKSLDKNLFLLTSPKPKNVLHD